jgi:hypothetical protein
MIKIDTRLATTALAELTAQLTASEVRKANARAINHTLAKARTAASQEIRSVYNMKAADAKKAMSIRKANVNEQYGELKASSSTTPLSRFNPRQTTPSGVTTSRTAQGWKSSKGRPRKTNTGVTVSIFKGKRVRLPSAFMVFSAGIKGVVMARGRYQDQAFAFRRGRGSRLKPTGSDTPISSLQSVSVFSAAINDKVQQRMSPKIGSDFTERMAHELRFMISKLKP